MILSEQEYNDIITARHDIHSEDNLKKELERLTNEIIQIIQNKKNEIISLFKSKKVIEFGFSSRNSFKSNITTLIDFEIQKNFQLLLQNNINNYMKYISCNYINSIKGKIVFDLVLK